MSDACLCITKRAEKLKEKCTEKREKRDTEKPCGVTVTLGAAARDTWTAVNNVPLPRCRDATAYRRIIRGYNAS